jgi:hypothetical protein
MKIIYNVVVDQILDLLEDEGISLNEKTIDQIYLILMAASVVPPKQRPRYNGKTK